MKRYALLATAVTAAGVAAYQGTFVNLQGSTPGSPQNGHLNITGTAKAGTIVGYSTETAGIAYGGDFRSASTSGRGILGNASATTGATYGGLFQSFSNGGRGVAGIASNSAGTTYGGFFSSLSNQGRGVYGQATNASGTTYGVYGKAVSPNGFGVFSDGNLAATGIISGDGSGLINLIAENLLGIVPDVSLNSNIPRLDSENFFTGGVNRFESRMKIGDANVVQDLAKVGIYQDGDFGAATLHVENGTGNVLSVGRVGVGSYTKGDGTNFALLGVANSWASNSYGVIGAARGSGPNYGVYGTASNSVVFDYAGYFQGFLYATTVSSGVKAFMIDHPMDPANKVLSHSSIESDEMMNLYRGNVKTDSQGFATVSVPGWFDALNEDIQYQLTIIGDESDSFMQVKVAKKIANGKFKIRTSAAGAEVHWQATGRRKDPTAKHYPLEVERMKVPGERGKYYAPEAYGKGKEFAVGQPSGSAGTDAPTAAREKLAK